MISGQKITKSVKGKCILDHISIEIEKDSVVAFLGPSGSGKTSILRLIMGLEPHESGRLVCDGILFSKDSKIIVAPEKRGFSFMFQEFTLFPHLNVFDNIMIGVKGKPSAKDREKAMDLLGLFNIAHLKSKPIHTLSGGEQQRIALARALMVNPMVLLLDEPFSNIDKMMKKEIFHDFKKVLKQYQLTTVFATHDHGEAFFFSDKIYVIKEGRIVDVNTPENLYAKPRNSWVASFVGEANFLSGKELSDHFRAPSHKVRPEQTFLVRPEDFLITSTTDTPGNAVIEETIFSGFYTDITAKLDNGRPVYIKTLTRERPVKGQRVDITITAYQECPKEDYKEG